MLLVWGSSGSPSSALISNRRMVPSPGVKLCSTVVRGLSKPRRYAVGPSRPGQPPHHPHAGLYGEGRVCHQVVLMVHSSTMIGIATIPGMVNQAWRQSNTLRAQVITGKDGGRGDSSVW